MLTIVLYLRYGMLGVFVSSRFRVSWDPDGSHGDKTVCPQSVKRTNAFSQLGPMTLVYVDVDDELSSALGTQRCKVSATFSSTDLKKLMFSADSDQRRSLLSGRWVVNVPWVM